jgi:tRNA-2-methylthio-N6-dimethylallyladenosine synthase
MNKHDSERIAGLLAAGGMRPVDAVEDADVIVFNTCCVRERAEERLLGQVSSLAGVKARRGSLLAVGGCMGQKDGARLLERAPTVDVVFGTHNVHELPDLLDQAERGNRVASSPAEHDGFTSDLPARRDTAWRAWLPITIGCDNHCTYCIVPSVRGPERSRSFEDIVSEANDLVDDGVVEVTLLGQNVNSYGRDRYGEPRFAPLLRAVADTGVDRVRFTTSHPKDLSDATIAVMAEPPNVCRHLHLPVQSGSDRILAAMGRRYTKRSYLELVDRLYDAMPDLALSTDIMVGFPGETERDHAETLDVVRKARFDQAFTFIFSPREGTPAASMTDAVARDVAQERFDELVELVNDTARACNVPYVGTLQRVLVEGPSKRDPEVLLGRSGANKVVHAPCPDGVEPEDLAGTFADIEIDEAHTWFLAGRLRARQR